MCGPRSPPLACSQAKAPLFLSSFWPPKQICIWPICSHSSNGNITFVLGAGVFSCNTRVSLYNSINVASFDDHNRSFYVTAQPSVSTPGLWAVLRHMIWEAENELRPCRFLVSLCSRVADATESSQGRTSLSNHNLLPIPWPSRRIFQSNDQLLSHARAEHDAEFKDLSPLQALAKLAQDTE